MIEDAFTQSDYAIHILDPSGRFKRVNGAFLKLYRYGTDSDILGMDAGLIHSAATPLSTYHELGKTVGSGRVWRGNLTNRAKDGSEVHIHFTATPILRGGRLAGIMGFSLDRAQLLMLERQLFNASKLAVVGTLGAGLAHELNNPLASIILDAEYLRDLHAARSAAPLDNADALQAAESVLRGAERIKAILNHLLLYAKQDADTAPSTLSVGHLLRDSLLFLERQLQSKGIAIRVEASPGLTVVGNRTQLESVLHNLLGNSRDAFAGLAGSRKEISIHAGWLEGEGMVSIRYRDNAGGMPESVRERIFEPFFTTKGSQGSGLGLAVSRQIVNRHGGQIECVAREDGTEFVIRLPGNRTGSAEVAGVLELPALV